MRESGNSCVNGSKITNEMDCAKASDALGIASAAFKSENDGCFAGGITGDNVHRAVCLKGINRLKRNTALSAT